MKKKKKNELVKAKFEVLPLFTAFFVTGIAFSGLFEKAMPLIFLFLSGLCLILSWLKSTTRYHVHILCLAAVFSGFFYGNLGMCNHDYRDFARLDGCTGTINGTFVGEYRALKSGGISLKLSDVTFATDDQQIKIPGRVQCRIKTTDLVPEPEQHYFLTEGRFIAPAPGRLPVFKCNGISHSSAPDMAHKLAGRLQRKIRDGLNSVLPKRQAAIVIGFILGDTSQISLEDRRLFRETGISHILAVSGQHVMIIIVLLAAILHWLRIPPLSRSILVMLILVGYAMTTSGSPSIWRALVMYVCAAAVIHLEAFPCPTRPVCTAGFLLLLYDPTMLFNAAFQLSFVAVISIIFLRRPLEKLLQKAGFPDFFARYLAVTFAANLGTIPLTAYVFGTVSIAALLVNPLILWSFSYIMPLAFATALLSFLWPSASILVAPGLSLFLDGMLLLLQKFHSLPGGFIYVGNLSPLTIVTAYCLLLFLVTRYNLIQIASIEPQNDSDTTRGQENVCKSLPSMIESRPAVELRTGNPFRSAKAVGDIDTIMSACRRRSIKSTTPASESGFPVNLLSIDNQNLFHQLTDLGREIMQTGPERLLQAQIYLMALSGSEILNRIAFHLHPSPAPDELKTGIKVRDRHLATAMLADMLLNSSILTRISSNDLIQLLSRGQTLFARARNQLERILEDSNRPEALEQHLALRRDLLLWCREFIEFDLNAKRQTSNPEK
jgi:ComEC/Rec2-related protein